MKILLSAILVCLGFNLSSQVVEIPDVNFKTWLINNVDINTNGDNEIQLSEAEAYTGLMQPASNDISSMVGIEAFTEIEVLNCINNNISELDLSNNLKLKRLSCYTNDIQSLDISMLTDLEYFNAHSNDLTVLDCSQNDKLEDLYLQGNKVEELDLSNLPILSRLVINNNNLSSIDLSLLPNLGQLNISSNPIGSIDVSTNLNLSTFRVGETNISELDISNNEEMRFLVCSGNGLSNLDVSNNKFLNFLDCRENQLDTLNLDSLLTLKNVLLDNNLFTNLDLSHLTELVQLWVNNNQLESLNIANGNNEILEKFSALNNTELSCVKVDDEAFPLSAIDWAIDESASYSENCSIVSSASSIDEADSITIFPNPAGDILHISAGSLNVKEAYIYDSIGELCGSYNQDVGNLNLTNLRPGFYTVDILLENGKKLTKVLVKL